MLIDSHLHLSKDEYEDISKVVKRANDNDVKYLIVSCCSMKDIEEGISLLDNYENIFLSIGLHPSEAPNYTDDELGKISMLARENPRVVAIGEIGLDYHYGKDDIELQKKLFDSQLKLATQLDLPVVIHTREAVEDTIAILKKYNLRGVIHCFSGSYEIANIYTKMGYKLGIGGVLTFKNSKLKEVVSKLDLSTIILETDSPYLSPEPVRGSRNEPANVKYVAEYIANIKNIDLQEVSSITTSNVIEVFDLKHFLWYIRFRYMRWLYA